MAEKGVNAVDRALSIVEAFRQGDEQINLQTIAERTHLNKATIIRLIASLERFGYMRRVGQGVYALGPAFLNFASLYQSSFRLSEHTLPVLRELVHQTGESAAFFIRDGDIRICLHKVESNTGDLVSRLREGDRRALLPGGTGKVMLAFSNIPSERKAWPQIAKDYVFVNLGERSPEIVSVVAPVFRTGQVLSGVLSLSGPNTNFTPELTAEHRIHVLRAAALLTQRLGGNPRPLQDKLRTYS